MKNSYTETDVEVKLRETWNRMKRKSNKQGIVFDEEWDDFDTFSIQVQYLPGWDEKLFMLGKLILNNTYFSRGEKAYYGRKVCCWLSRSTHTRLVLHDPDMEINFPKQGTLTVKELSQSFSKIPPYNPDDSVDWDKIMLVVKYL
jgi:hypothetical protein